MKDVLIINPKASKGIRRFREEKILEGLSAVGIIPETFRSEHPGHTADLAEAAAKDGADRIFISGGDGSINEAVNGLVNAQKQGFTGSALGFIPSGRGNDFCDALEIPKKMSEIAEILKRDHRMLCDIGNRI